MHEIHLWVEVSAEQKGPYTNLLEITRAGAEPTLPGMENL